ncbi:MAG: amino acid permease [Gammaproteobacteria bacterium]|jgi:APA family basic amino acid/polyamine antiporter
MQQQSKPLGLWTLTALVSGNMIGSGIFLLPSTLAKLGSISLLAWILTALGAFCIAITFAKSSTLVKHKSGGPYAYAEVGFGRFIGFQTAYNYWIAVWVGNAAIAIAAIGYLIVFFPIFNNTVIGCILAIVLVWLFTIVNLLGMRVAGFVQILITILKFIPIFLFAIIGWWYFHPSFLTQHFNVTPLSNFKVFSYAIPLTLWAFIGIESATIPAESVNNPEVNIPLATLLGTLIATVAYLASATVIMGMIPMQVLAHSTSPFAAAADVIFGKWGNWLIALGAIISCLGCLNGWILIQAQIPMAAADDDLFPKIFAKRNKDGIPAYGIIITSICMTLLLLITTSPDLNKEFQIIISIAVIASLISYFYTAIAEIILLKKEGNKTGSITFHIIIAIIAATYSFWAIAGTTKNIVFYQLLLLLSSVPLYSWEYWLKKKNVAENTNDLHR